METPLLICVRVLEMEVEPAQGSAAMHCSECDAPIWVAPSSQEMLTGGACKLVCMQCAAEFSRSSLDAERDVPLSTTLERLQAQAESAYDQMYEPHSDREIRWHYELADDCLRQAILLAGESGFAQQAERMEARRLHIRNVYYHQFAPTPRLLM